MSMDRGTWLIRHKKLKSEIQFVSAERDTNVRSAAANLIIFDEAAFLNEKTYETAVALVRTTKGMVYIISTVNPDTPKNRFYYKLVEAEIEMYNNTEVSKLAKRITLHDNPFIDDEEKQNIIRDGQRNPKIFGAEWMCEFQESESFDLKNFWKIDYEPMEKMFANIRTGYIYKGAALREAGGTFGMDSYDKFYIGYDAAKRKDQPGLTVVGTKTITTRVQGIDVQKQVAEIVLAGYMSHLEYYDQVKVMVDIRNFFGPHKTDIVVELNNTGIVIEEILRREHNVVCVGITAIGGNTERRDSGGWYVGKQVMLGKIKTAMSMKQLFGYSFMSDLRAEFEAFDEENERTNGHHFDIISALRGVIRYISKT